MLTSISLTPEQDPSVSQHHSAGSQSFDGLLCPSPCFLSAASVPVVSMEGSHSLYSFINSYQMMFFTLFALLAGTAIVIIGGSHFFIVVVVIVAVVIKMAVVFFSPAVLHNIFTPREQSHPAFITRTPKMTSSTVTVVF